MVYIFCKRFFIISCTICFLGSIVILVGHAQKFNEQFRVLNQELQKFNELTPSAIEQVSRLNIEIHESKKEVHGIFSKLTPELVVFNKSFETLNSQIPLLLFESENLRKDLPVIVTNVETILGRASDVSRTASKGAVEGVLQGVFSLPAELISSAVSLPVEAVKLTSKKVSEPVTDSSSENIVNKEL